MKKLVSFVLVMAIVCSLTAPALAVNGAESKSGLTTEQPLTMREREKLDSYTPNFQTEITREDLIDLCEVVETKQDDSRNYVTYTSQDIQSCLYDFGSELYLGATEEKFYISYLTTSGDYVVLAYSDDGLIEKGVHNQEEDVYYYISETEAYSFESCHYAMSAETRALINRYLENEDIDGLAAVDGIQVIADANGNIIIQEDIPSMAVGANPGISVQGIDQPTSETELLNSLKSAFPMYNHSLKHSTSAYCDALGKNINIRVYETRNDYTKTSADYKVFLVGATITAISLYLGLNPSLIEYILAALSIGISLTDTILEDVTLYRQAHFDYTFSRVGYAYDSTVYNDYVRVIEYTDTGVFAGGYDNEEVFRWIYDEYPSSYDVSYGTIVDRTIYNYNSDVFVHNSCTLYFPDWV